MGGRFVWYDLMTTDPSGAKAFYSEVVGFGLQPFEGDPSYEMWMAAQSAIGGVNQLPKDALDMGAVPHWLGYVSVDDVDATAQKAVALGGQLYVPPTDIPGVGRFAVFAGPDGAVISAFRSVTPGEGEGEMVVDRGHVVWNELMAGDLDQAWAFYTELFGWHQVSTMQMGEAGGEYRMYGPPGAEGMLGGMMTKPPMVPVAHWLYYFHVDDVSAAAQRARDNGGQIHTGPMQIPGGEWVAIGFDPQGGAFAVHSKVNAAAEA